MSKRINLNREELRDRISGCWLGKNIGGTVGGPFEGRRELLDVKGYTTPSGEPLPNDDLDLQLVWLRALQERGPLGISAQVLGEYWLNFIPANWNEYGICKSNMRAGLLPPLSGMYRNPWKHSNGAWIRSEIWACISPGAPDTAARYAYEDASVDHGGGEGTYAALFTAAMQSAAFVVSDRKELIRIALARIPEGSRVSRSVRLVYDSYEKGLNWQKVREMVVQDSQDLGWFQAPANVAFAVIGILYGEGDFGRSVCIAASCGDDTDCTAATAGATLGIILGRRGIPKEWAEPLGDRIITVAIDRSSFFPPLTIGALTDAVLEQAGAAMVINDSPLRLGEGPTDTAELRKLDLATCAPSTREIWERSPYAVAVDLVHTKVFLDYGKEPDVAQGVPFKVKVKLVTCMTDSRHAELIWHLPPELEVRPGPKRQVAMHHWPRTAEAEFEIVANSVCEAVYRGVLEVRGQGRPTVGFVPAVFFGA